MKITRTLKMLVSLVIDGENKNDLQFYRYNEDVNFQPSSLKAGSYSGLNPEFETQWGPDF